MVIAGKRLTRTRPSTCSKNICVYEWMSEWSEGLLRTCLEYDYYGGVGEQKEITFLFPVSSTYIYLTHCVATRNDDNDDRQSSEWCIHCFSLWLSWLFVWFHHFLPAASLFLLFELIKLKAENKSCIFLVAVSAS